MEKAINIIINNLAEMAYIDYLDNEAIKANEELDKTLELDNLSKNFDFKLDVLDAITTAEAEYERVGFVMGFKKAVDMFIKSE